MARSALLNVMVTAVRKSTRGLARDFGEVENLQVSRKGPGDFVTAADKRVEKILLQELDHVRPGYSFLTEETGVVEGKDKTHRWIIDPIDGTHNFAAGNPPFGIILAKSSGGVAQSGWIYDPLKDRFCHAHQGEGAFIDGEKITAKPAGKDRPIAAISMIFLTPEQREMVDRKLAPHYDLAEIPRCAAEQYPRLALGENDLSSFKRTLAWDHAAGVLWLNEAGGKAARLDGSAYRVDEQDKPGLVGASSPALWDEFVGRILAPE